MKDQKAKSVIDAIYSFFGETIIRFRSKSPKFFVALQKISMIIAVIAGVPELLDKAGIVLPPAIDAIKSQTVFIIGIIAYAIAKLPVADPAVLEDKEAK